MASSGDAFEIEAGSAKGLRFLIVEARFYTAIADELLRGAEAVLKAAGAEFDSVTVPGSLEIPAAVAMAMGKRYDGFIALGCVVRGETSHYDSVCGESARGLMELSIRKRASIGYGILTVNTLAQAEERADPKRGDKGGESVRACAAMIALKRKFGEMMQ